MNSWCMNYTESSWKKSEKRNETSGKPVFYRTARIIFEASKTLNTHGPA